MTCPSLSARRVVCVLAAALLVACGSDPVTPEPAAPDIARWAGSYTGQSRFGATAGRWGNGGSYPLVITDRGDVTVSGVPLLEATYDDATATLSWTRSGGNATNGEVTFRASHTSDFFFRDLPNAMAGQSLSGYIQRAGEGRLDYRGVLR